MTGERPTGATGTGTPEDPLFFDGPEAFEAWLAEHHASSPGVWLKIAKKHTGIASLSWATLVEVVLCWGWIDGQLRRIDDDFHMQRVTPRRPRSTWSKINRQKVEALIAAGRMRPPGLAEVERAKADGRWEAAYDSPATATVPDDLAAALEAAGARPAFDALTKSQRYSILHPIMTAVKPETRARRIAKHVDLLARGEGPGS
ncbi:MAG TPA: YdeI/OmpD-associated family protein [Capillimicrobium sp.]